MSILLYSTLKKYSVSLFHIKYRNYVQFKQAKNCYRMNYMTTSAINSKMLLFVPNSHLHCTYRLFGNNIGSNNIGFLIKFFENFKKHSRKLDYNNGFDKCLLENSSWNNTVNRARKLCDYKMDLFKRLKQEFQTIELMDYKQFLQNEYFQQFSWYVCNEKKTKLKCFFLICRLYSRTYNYQITGLITILLTKLYLYSSPLLPEEKLQKIIKDVDKLAECYDMISYGFYFHDITTYRDSSLFEKSLRNLMILLGDYFLVKSSIDVASFHQLDLYKTYVNTMLKICEGESICLEQFGSIDSESLILSDIGILL